ncbi:rod shape-determining protein MreD [Pseudooceanicola sp. 216_PA32_1]|uniref:Rod shape-determining protein MreD n=1 Tax=Pseudooceanicola pacificus TaxID=2676438 RepID=A0A844WC72_9RHOB|nr:rod shape-determining protein MreD [Pseudooceanicola pacificus]MWB77722.1 rod shape-determining protein MreD [Pseudooceanicola pacificus]
MAEATSSSPARRWTMRLAFVLIALALILFNLMPLETVPRRWAGPDVLLALCCAWTLRRPEFAPALMIGMVILLADLLFQRPPGLMAALVVLACEWLKARARVMRELPFPAEWLAAALAMAAVLAGYRVVLALFMVEQAPLMLSVMQLVATVVIYPLVVLLSLGFFGLRKTAPGEVDTLGHRL